MSQKYIKSQNNNPHNTGSYGKYYATAVYDNHFVGTEELADFIQRQASVKKSDIKAVLQELGEAMKHFFELGQKVKLDGIGILKVGFSSIGVSKLEDCTAATITTRRVLFQPETERVVVGQAKNKEGKIVQKYVNAITLLKDVVFRRVQRPAVAVLLLQAQAPLRVAAPRTRAIPALPEITSRVVLQRAQEPIIPAAMTMIRIMDKRR